MEQKIIICWGDSLTEGMGMAVGAGTKYPDALQNMLGDEYKVWNGGYSGDKSVAIMSRQGAYKLTVKEDICFDRGEFTVKLGLRKNGFGFLLDDGTELNCMNVQVGSSSPNPTIPRINPVVIDGEPYSLGLTFDGVEEKTDGAYYVTLTRASAEFGLRIPAGASVTLGNTDLSASSYCELFLIGANDALGNSEEDVALLISRYQRMVDHLTHDRYLAIIPYWSEGALIEPFKKAFGDHAVSVMELITPERMQAVGITPNEDDLARLEKYSMPASLRYLNRPGDVHLNEHGYKLIAQFAYERGQALGYWK